jgi:hypothetical protein
LPQQCSRLEQLFHSCFRFLNLIDRAFHPDCPDQNHLTRPKLRQISSDR